MNFEIALSSLTLFGVFLGLIVTIKGWKVAHRSAVELQSLIEKQETRQAELSYYVSGQQAVDNVIEKLHEIIPKISKHHILCVNQLESGEEPRGNTELVESSEVCETLLTSLALATSRIDFIYFITSLPPEKSGEIDETLNRLFSDLYSMCSIPDEFYLDDHENTFTIVQNISNTIKILSSAYNSQLRSKLDFKRREV